MRVWMGIVVGLWTLFGQAQIATTAFAEVEQLLKKEQRPILIFFYTDWCSYCELMKRKTFTDSQLIHEINANYYLIFFDGESKEEVIWKGQKWKFVKKGLKSGTHQLAEYFAQQKGVVSYPSVVLLDSNWNKIYQHTTYLKASELDVLLKVIY